MTNATKACVGLVVLNYNNSAETSKFLSSATQIETIDFIQVVDNASTDGSYNTLLDVCDELDPDRTFLAKAPENKGYGNGNNYGFRELGKRASFDYLAIANPDVQFDERAITEMAGFLSEHDEYAAVAPLMLNPSGEVCQSAWKLPTAVDMFLNALRLAVPVIKDPLDYGRFGNNRKNVDVDVLPGSLFMIRSLDFELVGGFDEDTFLYGEENLLFAKLNALQRKRALLLDVDYVHAHGTSIIKEISSVKKRYLMQLDSNLVYCDKALKASRFFRLCYRAFFKLCLAAFSAMYSIRNLLSGRIEKRGRGSL